jgi:hypothetical protein
MNVEHERALRLRALVPDAPVEVPWRTHGILLRIVLFGLTLAAVAALYFLIDERGLITGAIAVVIAELLINARRWWWTGIEEALWIGGVFAAITDLPESGTPEALLVLAAAAAIPGARMRNPLFGALAAIFVVAYFEKKWDLGVLAALVMATVALFALLRTWRRPSTEWLWIALALALPVAGRFYADEVWRNVTIILYGAFGALALFLAIRHRHHALFFSGAIGIAIAGTEVGRMLPAPLELKLAGIGAFLLAGAWLTARALRGRTTGIVATPSALTEFDDQLEVAATAALPREEFEQKMESGGEFGGAGATGKY